MQQCFQSLLFCLRIGEPKHHVGLCWAPTSIKIVGTFSDFTKWVLPGTESNRGDSSQSPHNSDGGLVVPSKQVFVDDFPHRTNEPDETQMLPGKWTPC